MRKAIKLTAAAAFAVSAAFSQTNNDLNVVTSAVPFLRISPDAKAGGMGDVGIATNPDANSAFWNNAKTIFNKSKGGVTLTYTPWLKDLGINDVFFATANGYYKLDDKQAISGGLRYFNLGKVSFTDFSGNPLGDFSPREFAFDAGYSRKLSDKNSVGLTARYINSSLANGVYNGANYKPGNSVAADLSFFHNGVNAEGKGISYGVVLNNLGSKISYTDAADQKDYLPANLGVGVSYSTVTNEVNKFNVGLDVNKLLVPTSRAALGQTPDEYRSKGVVESWFTSFGDAPGGFAEEIREFNVSVGAEYTYQDQFSFRAGYFYEHPTKGNRKFFTLGAGLKYNNLGMNVSYLLPSGGNAATRMPLSNTLRFSVTFDFGKDNAEN